MKFQDHHLTHLKAWQASGLTQTAYCQKQGLNVKTFSRWLKASQLLSESPEHSLIPIEIKAATPVEATTPLRLMLSKGQALELPANTSPPWLAELLQCLS